MSLARSYVAHSIEFGSGVPSSVSNKPQLYVDAETGILYIKGQGDAGWAAANGSISGLSATATAALLGVTGSPLQSAEVTFTETATAGVYTGSVSVPAGATIQDIIVNGVALWDTGTSATMKVGDAADDDGYFTGVNLKATDLLAGESISFLAAGGKAGAYIANSQVSPRYSATARVVSGIVTTVGTGTAGRTRMTVLWSAPQASFITAATKV